MLLLGVTLGCIASTKLVGVFFIIVIGMLTAFDLWELVRTQTLRRLFLHFVTRVGALIVLPVAMYVGLFAVHFHLLPRSGPGDLFMSHRFQVKQDKST